MLLLIDRLCMHVTINSITIILLLIDYVDILLLIECVTINRLWVTIYRIIMLLLIDYVCMLLLMEYVTINRQCIYVAINRIIMSYY